MQEEDLGPAVELNAMLDLTRRSYINLKKALTAFFVIVVISEFQLQEKIEMDELKELVENNFSTSSYAYTKSSMRQLKPK